jgi:hypothetical protein
MEILLCRSIDRCLLDSYGLITRYPIHYLKRASRLREALCLWNFIVTIQVAPASAFHLLAASGSPDHRPISNHLSARWTVTLRKAEDSLSTIHRKLLDNFVGDSSAQFEEVISQLVMLWDAFQNVLVLSALHRYWISAQ